MTRVVERLKMKLKHESVPLRCTYEQNLAKSCTLLLPPSCSCSLNLNHFRDFDVFDSWQNIYDMHPLFLLRFNNQRRATVLRFQMFSTSLTSIHPFLKLLIQIRLRQQDKQSSPKCLFIHNSLQLLPGCYQTLPDQLGCVL